MAGYHSRMNVLIVDDEEEACTNLRNILLEYVDPTINIVGEAHNTLEAEKLITKHSPAGVFLDIEMPNENAFSFLERISPVNFEVVFVTAYDDYAIRAFKLNAVDYILKPLSIPELKGAVAKLSERIQYKSLLKKKSQSYVDLSEQVNGRVKGQKITLKEGSDVVIVDFKDIYFIEAQGSYSRIVFAADGATREIVLSSSLSDYEELMPEDQFYRIHKSYLVNCFHVTRILKDGTSQIVINDKYTLPISRRRFQPLLEFLKNNDYQNE